MRRRVLPVLSALVVCVAAQPAAAASPQARPTDSSCPAGVIRGDDFLDVPVSDPHEAAVDCMVHWAVANGRTPALYDPAGLVTREQMATFIARVVSNSGGALPAASRDHFRDDDTSGHQDSINRLAEAGIVSGTGPGTYHPQRSVTRAQMAAFLVRAYDYRAQQASKPSLVVDEDYFPDDENETLEPQINAAARAGFTGGYSDGTYRPGSTVLRDQMASFLARVLDAFVDDLGAAVPPAAAEPQLTAQTPITQRGAGVARVGMTLREIEAATGREWVVDSFEYFDRYCYYAAPAGLEDTFYAIVESFQDPPSADPRDGVVTAIGTSRHMPAGGRAAYGLGVRDSWQRVQQVVGGAVTTEQHVYDPDGIYVNLDSPDAPGMRLRLSISDGVVSEIDGGMGPAASYVEGCA